MQSAWKVPGRSSVANPPEFVSGEPPPTLPPDPPDPSSPLSPANFPSLSQTALPTVFSGARRGNRKKYYQLPTTVSAEEKMQTATTCSETSQMELEQGNLTLPSGDTVSELRSESATVNPENPVQTFTILHPQDSSPIQTNTASSSSQPPLLKPLPAHQKPSATQVEPVKPFAAPPQTLVEKLRITADMSLRRLAPVTLTPTGRPRVVIPDSVFKKGAEIHQDFIICYFNGRSPPFQQIQSVFNYM